MFEERKSKLCRPDYFVGGVRKGGTTALHTYISKHPEVFPFKVDQPHHTGEAIFSSMNKLDAGTTAYNRQFGRIPDNLLVGDASAHRLVDAKGGFFRDTCPGSKMFILLRDPVERLLSNIKMRLRSRKKHKKSKYVPTCGQRTSLYSAPCFGLRLFVCSFLCLLYREILTLAQSYYPWCTILSQG